MAGRFVCSRPRLHETMSRLNDWLPAFEAAWIKQPVDLSLLRFLVMTRLLQGLFERRSSLVEYI